MSDETREPTTVEETSHNYPAELDDGTPILSINIHGKNVDLRVRGPIQTGEEFDTVSLSPVKEAYPPDHGSLRLETGDTYTMDLPSGETITAKFTDMLGDQRPTPLLIFEPVGGDE